MRAFDGEQKFTGQSFVSVAPDGMDPCDLRLHKGDAAVRELIADRIPMFEFVIQSVIAEYSIDSAEGRLQALRRAVPVVAQIRDQPLQREYARRLAGWVGWPDPEEVLRQVRAEARKPKKAEKPTIRRFDNAKQQPAQQDVPMIHPPSPKETHLWPQREALKLALQMPQVAGSYFDGITADAYTNDAYRLVRQAISTVGGAAQGATMPAVEWIAAVAGEMQDLTGRNFVSELAVEAILPTDVGPEKYADSVLSRLQETVVGDQIAQLKARLGRMRPSDDEASYNSLFADLVALEQARRELNDRAFRGTPPQG